jgi:protein-S-isoprenylcysteine O-methyltransferase Ste14
VELWPSRHGTAGWVATPLFLCFHTFITLYEEPTLRRLFGASYEQYCAAVPRWVPKI